MSPEPVAILAVGVVPAGLTLQGQQSLGRRMGSLNKRMDGLDAQLRAIEVGLSEVRDQLTIVRDYISRRNTRPEEPPAAPAE